MFLNASDIGTKHQFPLMTFDQAASSKQEFHTPAWYQSLSHHWYLEDFVTDALPSDTPFSIYDQSATGTPTTAIVADATGGQYQIKLTNNSQVESAGITFGDNLLIQGNLPFLFVARLKVVHTMAANQVLWFGLGSDVGLDPDNITRGAFFVLRGDTNLLVEVDDNTTDTDDKDTGIDLTADTFYWFGIERERSGRLTFHFAEGDGENVRIVEFANRFGVLNPTFGNNNLQPHILVSKTTGTTTPEVIVDLVATCGARA